MIKSLERFKKYEVIFAMYLAQILAFIFIRYDFFDNFYEFTRAHESWELDEFISAAVAALIVAAIMMIRYGLLLRKAQEHIREQDRILAESSKQAELGKFAGGLAHEINNALQPVVGLSGIVANHLKDKDKTQYENSLLIQKAAIHAREIVNYVLVFARGQRLKPELLDAYDVIQEAAGIAAKSLPESIQFLFVPPEADTRYRIKSTRTGLVQIFENMFMNSADAISDEGGIIQVGAGCLQIGKKEAKLKEVQPGRFVCIRIRDNGCGMDSETLEKIFMPFFTTKKLKNGTGLGLPVCLGLIKEMGGFVTVSSGPLEGTLFSIYLPCVEAGDLSETGK